jgi:hypothetical protein
VRGIDCAGELEWAHPSNLHLSSPPPLGGNGVGKRDSPRVRATGVAAPVAAAVASLWVAATHPTRRGDRGTAWIAPWIAGEQIERPVGVLGEYAVEVDVDVPAQREHQAVDSMWR